MSPGARRVSFPGWDDESAADLRRIARRRAEEAPILLRHGLNPSADLAAELGEYFAARLLGLTRHAARNHKGSDAVSPGGSRFQIKTRRLVASWGAVSWQFREGELAGFDVFVGVVLGPDFSPVLIVSLPRDVVGELASTDRRGGRRLRWDDRLRRHRTLTIHWSPAPGMEESGQEGDEACLRS